MVSRLALAVILAAAVAACSAPAPTPEPPVTPVPSLTSLGAYEGDPCAIVERPVSDYFDPLSATFARAGSGSTNGNACEVTITREDGTTWPFTAQVLQFPSVTQADDYFDMAYVRKFGGSEANELGDVGLISVDPVEYTARVGVRSGAWVIILADLTATRTGDEAADDIAINDSARAFIDLMRPIVEQLS